MVCVFVAAQCLLLCLIVYLSAVLLDFTDRINVCGSLPATNLLLTDSHWDFS